jgi:hypothetical protein
VYGEAERKEGDEKNCITEELILVTTGFGTVTHSAYVVSISPCQITFKINAGFSVLDLKFYFQPVA